MTTPGDQPDKMAEVAGLASAIADRILEQNNAGTSIPPEQFRMLVRAARMLLDNDVPWPPSVEHIIMEVAKRVEEAKAAFPSPFVGTKGDDVVVRLTQAISAKTRT
jgi:hypothetical protein